MVRHSPSSSLGRDEYRARSKGRTILAQHAKSVKHCVANGLRLKNTCRTVQVLPECLRLSTIPAVHCNVAAKGSALESTIQSEKDTHGPCAQTLLLTDAPGCPTESATGSRQCYSLQCSLVHGSGRLFPTPLTEPDRRAKGNDIVTVHRTTYRSFTSSLLATQPQTAYVCHNSSINRDLQHAINILNDLAKA